MSFDDAIAARHRRIASAAEHRLTAADDAAARRVALEEMVSDFVAACVRAGHRPEPVTFSFREPTWRKSQSRKVTHATGINGWQIVRRKTIGDVGYDAVITDNCLGLQTCAFMCSHSTLSGRGVAAVSLHHTLEECLATGERYRDWEAHHLVTNPSRESLAKMRQYALDNYPYGHHRFIPQITITDGQRLTDANLVDVLAYFVATGRAVTDRSELHSH